MQKRPNYPPHLLNHVNDVFAAFQLTKKEMHPLIAGASPDIQFYEAGRLSAVHFLHVGYEIEHLVGVADFIVIP